MRQRKKKKAHTKWQTGGLGATDGHVGACCCRFQVEPGVVLLAYDKTSGSGRSGAVQKVYSVRITVDA